MQRPELNKAKLEDLIRYIEYQDSCLNGASELIIELNLTSKVFAEDLKSIREGCGDIIYIGNPDKTKKFEHAIALFDKIDKIKALSSYFKTEETVITTKKKTNFQDFVLKPK